MSSKTINDKLNATFNRMRADGIEPDENGQWEFADVIFYDADMDSEDKIYWLSQCPNQEARIEQLKAEKQ